MKPLRKQGIILFTVLALVLVACGGAAEETVEETTPEVVESLDSPAVTTASSVDTGVGVTAEPCPEAIGGVSAIVHGERRDRASTDAAFWRKLSHAAVANRTVRTIRLLRCAAVHRRTPSRRESRPRIQLARLPDSTVDDARDAA